MKKTLLTLGLVLGLCASLSQGWGQGLIPWHIDTYDVTSTATGSFVDISNNPNAITLGADMDANSNLTAITFGRTLAHDTTFLKNEAGADSVDASGKKVVDKITEYITDQVSHYAGQSAMTMNPYDRSVPGFPLGFKFLLGGDTMTHFAVSAYGGVFFRNDTLQPAYPSNLSSIGQWAVYAVPYLIKTATGSPAMATTAGQVISPNSGAPAFYLIDGEEGNRVLTVQHHYLVRGANTVTPDDWTFQFKFYEATGKIEFIVKELEYANALKGYHRIMVTLTNYAGYPKTREDGETFEPQDPYVTPTTAHPTALNIQPANNHRVYVGQTDAESTAKGWDTISLYWAVNANATMRIDAAHHPEPGHAIAFIPKNAPQTADITPLTVDDYKITDQTATATTFSAKLYYNAPLFTSKEFHELGPIVAILSESETPDYTLENGVWYKKGDELGTGEGFKPKVLAAQMSKATLSISNSTAAAVQAKLPGSNYEIVLTADKLEKAHNYYIHLYRMAYAGMNAPSYSTLCHTVAFSTDFAEPKQFTQVGLADIDKVKLKAEPADDLSVLIVKSKDLNFKPSGVLKKGDKIGDNAEVIELLSEEKEWDLPLEYGEGCFIVAFSVNASNPDNYIYAPTKKYFAVGTAYKELPGLIDFSGCPYGVPNFEYNGINTKTQDYGQRLQPTIARDLPFGYSRTPYTGGTQQRCFGLGKPGSRTPVTVYGFTVPDVDFITPPIVANKNRILMTFNANWVSFDDFGGSYDDYSFASNSNSSTICAIEYAIEDGAWQAGVEYKGSDEVFTTRDDNGYFPVSFSLIADEKNGESFIGKKIRFRFISKTTMTGEQGAAIYLTIPSVDIKEDKICKTPGKFEIVDAQTYANQISFEWEDENKKVQQSESVKFSVAYKVADDTTDNWLSKNANDTVCVINGLLPFTQYAFRVSADCGSYGTSYASNTVKFSTIHTFPYTETMAEDSGHYEVIGGTNAYIRGEDPFARGIVAATGTLPATGNAKLTRLEAHSSQSFNLSAGWDRLVTNRRVPQSLAVREFNTANTWLLTAPVFIKEYGLDIPQTIRFKANSGNKAASATEWVKGSLGSKYSTATLYVLLSHDGEFSMEDTIASIAVGTETIEDQAFEYEVPAALAKEGRAQVAFCFVNPNASSSDNNNDYMLFEIYGFEFIYAEGTCLPIDNLVRSNTTTSGATFTWEGSSDHYKVFWGTTTNYTDSISTTENTYTLAGLKDDTRYFVKVVGYCDEAETEIAPNEQMDWFLTFEACNTPTDFTVADITTTGATFSSTDEQEIMTQRLVYLTPEGGETRIIAQAKDQDALTVTNLLDNTAYVAQTRAVCDNDSSEMSEPITFRTLADSFNIALRILPDENAGTVAGDGRYQKGQDVTIKATSAAGYAFVQWQDENGNSVSTEATYTFKATANATYTALFQADGDENVTITLKALPNDAAGTLTGAGKYKKGAQAIIVARPADNYTFVAWLDANGDTVSKGTSYSFKAETDATYTALFMGKTANEQQLKAAFNVATGNGHLYIRNLKGLTVEEVTVYGLTGRQLGYFTPNSREDLALPINAERALLLVRVASEQGVAIYKVYLH